MLFIGAAHKLLLVALHLAVPLPLGSAMPLPVAEKSGYGSTHYFSKSRLFFAEAES